MGIVRWNSLFDVIDEQITGLSVTEQAGLSVPFRAGFVHRSPQEARDAVYGPRQDRELRTAIWQHVIRAARPQSSQDAPWRLLMI